MRNIFTRIPALKDKAPWYYIVETGLSRKGYNVLKATQDLDYANKLQKKYTSEGRVNVIIEKSK